jgi:hypothetical protein
LLQKAFTNQSHRTSLLLLLALDHAIYLIERAAQFLFRKLARTSAENVGKSFNQGFRIKTGERLAHQLFAHLAADTITCECCIAGKFCHCLAPC